MSCMQLILIRKHYVIECVGSTIPSDWMVYKTAFYLLLLSLLYTLPTNCLLRIQYLHEMLCDAKKRVPIQNCLHCVDVHAQRILPVLVKLNQFYIAHEQKATEILKRKYIVSKA